MKIQVGNIIHAHIPDRNAPGNRLKCAIVVVENVVLDGTTAPPTSGIYDVYEPESGQWHQIEHWKHFIRPATDWEVKVVRDLCLQRLLRAIVSELESISRDQGHTALSSLLAGYQGGSAVDDEA